MKTLHHDKYFHLAWDVQNSLFYFYFTEYSVQMSQQEYMHELEIYISFLKIYHPKGAWGNMVNFRYAIAPDTQEWINEHIFSLYATLGFAKLALLSSKDYISNLSLEQTMECDTTNAFVTKFFTNEKEAKYWLLSSHNELVLK